MSSLNSQNEQGRFLVTSLPVVGVAAVLLCAADVSRGSARFRNDGLNNVYIGSSVVVVGNGILLLPGAVWIERDAAAADWWGISAVAGNTVNVMETR